MVEWMVYTMVGFCAICAYCTWYVNHCARKTQKIQSDEISHLRFKLAAEQSYSMELSRQVYNRDHPKIRGYECSVIAVDEYTDEIPKQNLDPRKYKLCKGHVNPDKEWPRK